jgi:hypothetical protein
VAPILQCPDCGTKHPLGQVPSQGAFPCAGCGRVLKVPEAVGQRAAAENAAVRPVPVASATSNPLAPDPVPVATSGRATSNAVPPIDEQALGALSPKAGRRPVGRLGSVPWWMRFLLWIVAIPLSFLIVFLIARAFGLFTTNQLSDVFLANNTSRFWPVARLLPFVALVTAGFVQAGVYGLARLRGRSQTPGAPPETPRSLRTSRGSRSSRAVSPAASRTRGR